MGGSLCSMTGGTLAGDSGEEGLDGRKVCLLDLDIRCGRGLSLNILCWEDGGLTAIFVDLEKNLGGREKMEELLGAERK